MKKLLSFVAIVSLLGSVAFAYDEGSTGPNLKRSIGAPASYPVKVLQLVRNGENGANESAMSNGDVVIWDCNSDDGVSVTYIGTGGNPSTSTDAVAGVVVGSIPTAETTGTTAVTDVGKRNWGYIQVYGLHSATRVTAVPITAGEGLRASATRGAAIGSGTTGPTASDASLGFAFDTSSSAGTAEVFVRTS